NNGNISFGSPYSTFSSNPFPDPSFIMVAPFWGDVDTRTGGTVKYKITPTAMYINWDNVGYYNQQTDKVNTFQLIITDGTDPVLPTGNNIAFCYEDMQWTTGSASSGVGGFGGTPATVGVNKGDGISFIQLGRFDQPGAAYDGGGGANDGVSWLDNQSLYFNVCSGTNIAPIANFTPNLFNGAGAGACDTLRICGINDTLIINSLSLSPEIGETTTVAINLYGTPGFSVLNNTPGNPANATVQIIASVANAGMNTITYTATDNGVPIQTTIVNLNIFVDTTGLSAFNPTISGTLDFCAGGSTTLNVNPNNLTSYIWNTGSIDTMISVTTGGEYWVTSELNGCYKTVNVDVVEHPIPTPVILGPLFNCTGNPTTLYVDSASIYTSFSWSNTSTNDSISVGSGTYTVTVTDSFGCTGTSPPVTVTNNIPAVSISGSATFCQNDSTTLTAVPTIPSGASYLWSTGSTIISTNIGSVGSVWVTVSYNNGCSVSDTISVNVIPLTFSTQNDTICQGDNYTLPGGAVVTTAGIYLDTLAGFSTCDSIVTTNLTVTPLADATISPVNSMCDNSTPVNLSVVTSGGIWSGNGITNSNLGAFDPSIAGVGQHTITYIISGACGNSDNIVITVNPSPNFSLFAIEDTCLASSGTILTTVISGTAPLSFLWNRGDASQDLLNVLGGTTYSLTVTDGNGCSTTKQILVDNMGDNCAIIAPNVITPNGDGENDFLVFEGLEHHPGSSLMVFNRWGNKIYENDNYKNDWSPRNISSGTYFYILTPGGALNAEVIKSTVSVFTD
ncbi:MAG: gliding motility-associated C-terminal domain-containing protein, partial [Flavobacteriales bacterium]|nr:gliding motility-associated C-terminal domain-containing protein [Flavobacteriales bacterium]